MTSSSKQPSVREAELESLEEGRGRIGLGAGSTTWQSLAPEATGEEQEVGCA